MANIAALGAFYILMVLGLDFVMSRSGVLVVGVGVQVLSAALGYAVVFEVTDSTIAAFPAGLILAWILGGILIIPFAGLPPDRPLLAAGVSLLTLVAVEDAFGRLRPMGYSYIGTPRMSAYVQALVLIIIVAGLAFLHARLLRHSWLLRSEAAAWGSGWFKRVVGGTRWNRVPPLALAAVFFAFGGGAKVLVDRMLVPDQPWLWLSLELVFVFFLVRELALRLDPHTKRYSMLLVLLTAAYIGVKEVLLPAWLPQAGTAKGAALMGMAVASLGVCAGVVGGRRRMSTAKQWSPERIPSPAGAWRYRSSMELNHLKLARGVPSLLEAEFEGGRIHLIRGANGSGKSTLLATTAGFQKAHEGDIRVLADSQKLGIGWRVRYKAVRRLVGFLPQLSRIVPPMAPEFLPAVTGVQGWKYPAYPCEELSGGTRRLIDLMTVIQAQGGEVPAALLLDEPFAGLDHRNSARVARLLEGISSRGTVVVIGDHRYSESKKLFYSSQVHEWTLGEDGLRRGTPEQPPAIRSTERRAALNGLRFFMRKARIGYHGREDILSVPLFEARGGSIVVIRGENASGKSTFLRSLVGWAEIRDGAVELDLSGRIRSRLQVRSGRDLLRWRHAKTVFVPQTGTFFVPTASVSAHLLAMGILTERSRRLMAKAGVSLMRTPTAHSGGQQRWISLVLGAEALLACDVAGLLLLDEPFAGINPTLIPEAWGLIEEVAARGVVILADHELAQLPEGVELWNVESGRSLNELRKERRENVEE